MLYDLLYVFVCTVYPLVPVYQQVYLVYPTYVLCKRYTVYTVGARPSADRGPYTGKYRQQSRGDFIERVNVINHVTLFCVIKIVIYK